MMEYLRKYLIFIRKLSNNTSLKPKFEMRLLIGVAVCLIAGIAMDILLPFNFFLNMIRGVVANLMGFATFSLLYVTSVRLKNNKIKNDRFYLPIRKRFSHQQRINLSILGGVILFALILLSSKRDSIYTLKASLFVSMGLILLSFSRSSRDEFIKNIFEIPDIKDLEFESNKKDKKLIKQKEKIKSSEKTKEINNNKEDSSTKRKFELYTEEMNTKD